MERTLKEKCKKCGCYEYLTGLQRFQCLATQEEECFPVSQTMNYPQDEYETPEPDAEDNTNDDDFPLHLEYEGLYGNSEMDDCREMGGDEW